MAKLLRRKGDPTDILLLSIMLFFLAISLAIVLFANIQLQEIISTTVLNETTAYSSINESFTNINHFVAQRAFTMFFAFLVIGILVSSFLIRVHPVFLFIYIITLVVTLFVTIYLANTYAMVVANPQLAEIAEHFAMTTFLMQHSIKILLGVGALSMIIVFGKISGGINGGVGDL
jgi:hypothetical protein